jgi:V/A-type H+-transporting ATPase subunit I
MFTTPMIHLLAVVLETDADRVTEVLLDEGILHFMNVSELKAGWSEKMRLVEHGVSASNVSDARKRIEGLLRLVGERVHSDKIEPELHKDLQTRKPLDLDAENKRLDKIVDELNRIRERQRSVQQEMTSLAEILVQIRTYGLGTRAAAEARDYTFISLRIGELSSIRMETFQKELDQIPSVVLPVARKDELTQLILISMKRDADRIEPILDRLGWKEVVLSREIGDLSPDITSDVEKRITKLKEEDEQLEGKKRGVVMQNRETLMQIWHQLAMHEQFYKIQTYFRKTSRTVMFSGWLPSEQRLSLVERLEKTTKGRCYIEWHDPRELSDEDIVRLKPPVQLHNPKAFAPFQMLVTNFTIPEYGTIDPTFFVVFAFLIMFGLMFADVGQGAVVAVFGLLGSFLFREARTGIRNLAKLIVWCGLSSMLFGALFGSYFGMSWFPPIWFDFHGVVTGVAHTGSLINDLFDVLAISIYFGMGIIGVGLLFNWINLVRQRKWGPLVLDKGGIVGGWIYGGGVYAAFYMVRHGYKELPGPQLLLLLVGIPAVLLFFKAPILSRSKKPFTILSLLNIGMEGIVELLEVFSGYLSNTLSFLRVAGLGIAHASLMAAFFELARMATPGGSGKYTIVSILILIIGNVLVIGLEGLSAGIQSLRLHYYEFFTKFLRGSGEAYSPISLRRVSEEA